MKRNDNELKAIDFFCSGGGMSYGLQQAGIDVLAGIDIDPDCQATYEANISGAKYILADIAKLKEVELAKEIEIKKNDDNLIMVGCSPCQYWTIIRTNKNKSQRSKNLLHEFHRFVKFYNPGYVVVENVPGILNKRKESGLDRFVLELEQQGYTVHFQVVNLNEYGVPETRKRFSLIANRVTQEVIFPKPGRTRPTVEDFIGVKNGFPRISAGHRDVTNFMHSTAGLSDTNLERLLLTPKNGGSRKAWSDTMLQLDAYKKKDRNISFSDTYGRMSWDKPAPTITTRFYSISNGRFAHPNEDRPISLREGATLQTFPKSYKFIGSSFSSIARMIGNAVPPLYAKKIGLAIGKCHASK
ncbi:MAG: DNA cytosine methyltransferase [Candidatus Nanopelagicaceae bacterium]|nr:DNA cytosine methyltransferase [Candidatus Nanopelagicaceae bacterium]